jgi:hypothetical protein
MHGVPNQEVMKPKRKAETPSRQLPSNPLPLPGSESWTPAASDRDRSIDPSAEERRVPSRMGPGEIPKSEGRFKMPFHLMKDDFTLTHRAG